MTDNLYDAQATIKYKNIAFDPKESLDKYFWKKLQGNLVNYFQPNPCCFIERNLVEERFYCKVLFASSSKDVKKAQQTTNTCCSC